MADQDDAPDWDWMVLINDEEQHSLWPAINEIPSGWKAVGPTGSKEDCVAYVDRNWSDLRPLSLRKSEAPTATVSL